MHTNRRIVNVGALWIFQTARWEEMAKSNSKKPKRPKPEKVVTEKVQSGDLNNGGKQSRLLAGLVAWMLIIIVSAVGIWIFFERAKFVAGNDVDDAGITYNFANNLADGYSIVLFPGGERVEGYSNPSWMFALALGKKLGINTFDLAPKMGYLFGALCVFLMAAFTMAGNGKKYTWSALAACLLLAHHGAHAIWSLSGMESPLYLFLILAGSFRLFIECDPDGKSRLPISPFLFFLLAITRPEGIIFFAMAVGFRILAYNLPGRKIGKTDGIWLAVFLLPWATYQTWHYIYFAWPLPNTYYGKVEPRDFGQIFSVSGKGFTYLTGFLKAYNLSWIFYLIPFAFLSKKGWTRALYLLGVLAFVMFFPVYSNGDWMRGWRFCAPVAAPLFLLAAFGVQGIANVINVFIARKRAWLATATGLVFMVVLLVAGYAALSEQSDIWLKKYEKKPAARIMGIKKRADYFRKCKDKFRFKDHEAALIDMDMGALTLFSGVKMMDVGKICNVSIAHNFHDQKNRKKFMQEYLLEENRPEFAHLRRGWGRATTLLDNQKFKKGYLYLPDDPKQSKRDPAGNYIRKDLLYFKQAPEPVNPVPFEPGMTLLHVSSAVNVVAHDRHLWLNLYWQRDTVEKLPKMRFRFAFEGVDGRRIERNHSSPIMGWLPTNKWDKNQIIGEWVRIRIPKTMPAGTYRLHLMALDHTSFVILDEKPLNLAVIVNDKLADKRGKEALELARKAAEELDIEKALGQFDMAADYFGEPVPPVDAEKFKDAICSAAVKKAEQLMNNKRYQTAAEILLNVRQRYPRDKGINEILWTLSENEMKLGRQAQKEGDPEIAYVHYSEASRLQPLNSWARRRAEETRSSRY